MRFKTEVEINCASGFYCKRNGHALCGRINTTITERPYCELFYPFLDTDFSGNILKCERCLLLEREARKEM